MRHRDCKRHHDGERPPGTASWKGYERPEQEDCSRHKGCGKTHVLKESDYEFSRPQPADQGEHWSFVRIDANEKALEVREKCRISSHCTLGAYYFETCRIYEELYHRYYKNNIGLEKGEKYIAPMYNDLIEKGKDVYICDIDGRKVHALGTPEELDVFRETAGVNG